MKNFFMTAVLVFSFIAIAAAQNMPSVQDRVARLKDRLSLTDQQAAKVDSIYTVAQDSVQNITATGQDRWQAMREIMTNANNEIEKILTDTQKTEYEKFLQERRSRMRSRPNSNN